VEKPTQPQIEKQKYVYHGQTLETYDNEKNLSYKELRRNESDWIFRRKNQITIGTTIYSIKQVSLADNDTVIVYDLSTKKVEINDIVDYHPAEPIKIIPPLKYDNVLFEKMQPKHLLAVLRRLRRYQYGLYCECCNMINGQSDQDQFDSLEQEINFIKARLKELPNVPNSRQRKSIRENRSKIKRDGGSHKKLSKASK